MVEVSEGDVEDAGFSQSSLASDLEMGEGHEVLVVEEEGDSFSSLSGNLVSGNEPPLSTLRSIRK